MRAGGRQWLARFHRELGRRPASIDWGSSVRSLLLLDAFDVSAALDFARTWIDVTGLEPGSC